MALPAIANVSCDIFRPGNAPPADADVPGVAGILQAAFHNGMRAGRLVPAEQRFSHVLLVEIDVDVRDNYDAGALLGSDADTVVIEAAAFRVVFVERRCRDAADDHLRVYLARAAVS